MNEATATEPEHVWSIEAGEILCSGLPVEIWDDIVVKWNGKMYAGGHPDLLVSLLHGPLFKAIFDEGRKRQNP